MFHIDSILRRFSAAAGGTLVTVFLAMAFEASTQTILI
jgi:hypothetical protein